MKKYIYWIESDKGGIGGYATLEEAGKALERLKLSTPRRIVKHEASECKVCGRLERLDLINSFGHCLYCEEHSNETLCL